MEDQMMVTKLRKGTKIPNFFSRDQLDHIKKHLDMDTEHEMGHHGCPDRQHMGACNLPCGNTRGLATCHMGTG